MGIKLINSNKNCYKNGEYKLYNGGYSLFFIY